MTQPAHSLIEIKHVSKSYDSNLILNDIHFDIKHGEFLTLLGPSGCGKTTLLKILSGFDMPDEGDIIINQEVITKLPPQKRNVHTVFQSYALFPHLNVFENVAFSLRLKKNILEDEIKIRVSEALKLVRLAAFSERNIKQLSGGQQQRVAIARAIINKPQVLLLDEPLSSLDYRLRKEMQFELKQLQKQLNMTFVFVTHDQEEALAMSDRIAVLNQGRVEQIGTPREVYENPKSIHVATFIGETNVFETHVQSVQNTHITTNIEDIIFSCKTSHPFQLGEKINLIVRPEDIRVWGKNEIEDVTNHIPGKIVDIIYKGSTVELRVMLPSGKTINASEFFDEDDDRLEYEINESVWVHWISGWEVILPYED